MIDNKQKKIGEDAKTSGVPLTKYKDSMSRQIREYNKTYKGKNGPLSKLFYGNNVIDEFSNLSTDNLDTDEPFYLESFHEKKT